MAQNLQIDPTGETTGQAKDYVLVGGSPVPSDRVQEASHIAIFIPQGKYMYGTPGQGSRLNTLQNVKRTPSIDQEAQAIILDAVNTQVVASGIASAAAMKNLATSRTGTSNQLEVIPAQTQLSQQLNFVPV